MREQTKNQGAAAIQQQLEHIMRSTAPNDEALEALCQMFQFTVLHEDYAHLDPAFKDILVDTYDSLRRLFKTISQHQDALPMVLQVLSGVSGKKL